MNFPILIFYILAVRSFALVQFGGQNLKQIQRENQQQQKQQVFLDRRDAFRRVLTTTGAGLLLSEAFPNTAHAKVRLIFFMRYTFFVLSVPFTIFVGLG